METIMIQVDPEVAKAFQSAQPEQQQKIQALANHLFRRAISSAQLQATMDDMSREAKSNGLTPEILQSILNE